MAEYGSRPRRIHRENLAGFGVAGGDADVRTWMQLFNWESGMSDANAATVTRSPSITYGSAKNEVVSGQRARRPDSPTN